MFRLINSLKNRKGFTLIELIVVLAVLAIIMAIAVPRFLGVKEQAKIDSDIATLGLIAKTAEFYYVQGKVPAGYVGNDKEIGDDTGLLDSLEADFPDLKFQSTTGDMADVELNVTASTGKAKTKLGSLESK